MSRTEFWRNGERGKRDVYCDKQIGKAVTALNCVLKGSWREVGSGGMTAVAFLSSIPPGHDHVILLHLHASLLPIVPRTPNQLPSTPNTV